MIIGESYYGYRSYQADRTGSHMTRDMLEGVAVGGLTGITLGASLEAAAGGVAFWRAKQALDTIEEGAPSETSVVAQQQAASTVPRFKPGPVVGVDPRTLMAGNRTHRTHLDQVRLDRQAELIRNQIPRSTAPTWNQSGVLDNGHHYARVTAEKGMMIDGVVLPGTGSGPPIMSLPVKK